MRIVGVLLIILGVIGIGYGGIRYSYPDKVIDAGPVEVSVTRHRMIEVPPVLGAVALAGGLAILLTGRRASATE